MADKQSPNERIAARMAAESDAQAKRLVTKLQSEFNGPDRTSVSNSTWHAMIRQNWDDPMWRQAQSGRIGDVQFATDAMDAFGIPRSALKSVQPDPAQPTQPTPLTPTQPLPTPTPGVPQ